jgi:hypothetical protein
MQGVSLKFLWQREQFASNQVIQGALFGSRGNHWIDPGCPSRRNPMPVAV